MNKSRQTVCSRNWFLRTPAGRNILPRFGRRNLLYLHIVPDIRSEIPYKVVRIFLSLAKLPAGFVKIFLV